MLGVTTDAPDEVIRAAYRALAAKYHPDRNPGDGGAELKLKRLNAAFRVLGDPEKRRQYDDLTRGPDATAEPAQEAAKDEPPRWNVPSEKPRSERAASSEPTARDRTGVRTVKERAARWGFLAVALSSIGGVVGAVFESAVGGAIVLGLVPALVSCRFLFLALAGVRDLNDGERTRTRKASGRSWRALGWLIGVTCVAAILVLINIAGRDTETRGAYRPAPMATGTESAAGTATAAFSMTLSSPASAKSQAQPQATREPKVSTEALCAQNQLCAKCRQMFGPDEDCYRYLSEPQPPKPSLEAACMQNEHCAWCRKTYGPNADCYANLMPGQ